MNRFESIKLQNIRKRLSLISIVTIIFIVSFFILKSNNKLKVIPTIQNINVPGKLSLTVPKNCRIYAVGTVNDGILIKHNAHKEWPLASLTKLMTAYIILKKHPLKEGENGPKIKITQRDLDEYLKFKKERQSVAKVFAGEILSERKLLEGMLIPSANNFAYILAKWNSGNIENFVKDMNKTAATIGLKNTHYVGPAGAKDANVSDAIDQFLLAKKIMKIKTFKHIVRMPQTYIPKEGVVYNVNYDLGKDGIQGIKTGSSSRALGNFIFYAVKHKVNMLGVLLGVNGKEPLMNALKDAKSIAKQLSSELFKKNIVKKGEEVGLLKIDKRKTKLIATKSLSITEYPGIRINFSISIKKHTTLPIKSHQKIGYLNVSIGKTKKKIPLETSGSINKPSIVDKIRHIYKLVNI